MSTNIYDDAVLLSNKIFQLLDDKYTISKEKFADDYVTDSDVLIKDQTRCFIKEGI